ncbi:hypothetical protein BGZ63DRAFT_406690 [Mariannaea sp. PMI_226]|nr:hypothetical protein BGZ63DRAFT_406690 [Mariannaea sp. PMI_226]
MRFVTTVLAEALLISSALAVPVTSRSELIHSDQSPPLVSLSLLSSSTPNGGGGGSNIMLVPTASSSTSAKSITWIPANKHQKTCENATFSEPVDDDPVTPADWEACAALYSEWASFNGTFNIGLSTGTGTRTGTSTGRRDDNHLSAEREVSQQSSGVNYTPILQSESCTFAIYSADLGKLVALGDVDINDILKTALQEYSSGTLLGVRGEVNCAVRASKGQKSVLSWQLYYPGA